MLTGLILSLLGGGGALTAACIFVPGFLPAAIAVAGEILRCKPCLVVIALFAVYVATDIHVTNRERGICQAADIAMQLKAVERDKAIAADTIKFQEQQLAALGTESAELKGKLAQYENAPKTACPIGADRANRLRDIVR